METTFFGTYLGLITDYADYWITDWITDYADCWITDYADYWITDYADYADFGSDLCGLRGFWSGCTQAPK